MTSASHAKSSAGASGREPAENSYVGVTPGTTVSSAIPSGQRLRGDGDADNPNDIDGNGDRDSDPDSDNPIPASYRLPDGDDKLTLAYGRAASPAVRRSTASVVERYYVAASAESGVAACSLLLPSLARAIPADYGHVGGPSYLRGARTCPDVMSRFFAHFHSELIGTITVVGVRRKGSTAQVVFSSRTMPASSVFLVRFGNSWRMSAMVGLPLP